MGKESGPASVSMEYDGIYMEAEPKEYIRSQFYLRKHSFSYYLWAHFAEGALSVRMLISAGEEFELDRWYSLPTAATENIWESFAEVVFDYSLDKPEKEDMEGTTTLLVPESTTEDLEVSKAKIKDVKEKKKKKKKE